MELNAAMTAVNGDALKQAIGISLLGKVNDAAVMQSATLMQDFTRNQQQISASVTPHLGRNLDISI